MVDLYIHINSGTSEFEQKGNDKDLNDGLFDHIADSILEACFFLLSFTRVTPFLIFGFVYRRLKEENKCNDCF